MCYVVMCRVVCGNVLCGNVSCGNVILLVPCGVESCVQQRVCLIVTDQFFVDN